MKKLISTTFAILFSINVNSQVAREWGTYYGASGGAEYGYDVANDVLGNSYMVGYTNSISGMTLGGHQNTFGGGTNDAIIIKIDSTGNRIWSSYYGGASGDYATSVITDASGNIYMAGYTASTGSISSSGFQNTHGGGTFDAFLVKFNSAGVRQWATYYGGTGDDYAYDLCIDPSGNIYMAGSSGSGASIASGGFDNTFNGSRDAFVAKFDANGSRIWATYYGGTTFDDGYSIITDLSGNVFLCGSTQSTNNIGSGGFQNTYVGGQDAFLVKFNSTGARQWGTYYGGVNEDDSRGIACDQAGNIYIVGLTKSTAGIALGGFQNSYGGGLYDGYMVKFNSAGTRQWGTYYGGSGDEDRVNCCITSTGNILMSGETNSTAGISFGGFQNSLGGSYDSFIARFDNTGARIVATYYGGTSADVSYSIHCDLQDNIYLCGYTASSSGIASGGFQNTFMGGSYDTYLVKFKSCISPPLTPGTLTGSSVVCEGSSNIYSVAAVSGASSYFWTLPSGWIGTSSTNSISANASANSGTISLTANNSCGSSSTASLAITVNSIPITPSSIAGNTTVCSSSSNTYTVPAVSGATSYTWTLPSGWTGTSSTNSITTTASPTSGNISVTANSTCGSSTAATLAVSVVPNAPSAPGTILGTSTICSGTSNTYSVTPVAGATSYAWTLPSGWTGTSSTNSITATANTASGNITVTANNTCGSSSPATLATTVNTTPTTPSSITGSAAVCLGSSNNYSVINDPSATSYSWVLPSGWSGTSSTNAITATASSFTGNISVTANNSCGNSSPSVISILSVLTTPVNPGTISGSTSICDGSSNTYSVSPMGDASTYNWTLPSGWTGTSTNSSINTIASLNGGTISVTGTNFCGTSSAASITINVNSIPATPGTISGTASICEGSNNSYFISSVSGAASYSWSLPSGWSGTSTTNSISTSANSTSGNITVTANNSCGISPASTLAINVNNLPNVTLILTNDTLCSSVSTVALSGGSPIGGTYSGTGVSSGNFNPSTAGIGSHVITYSFTDGNSCTNTSTANIVVDICTGFGEQNSLKDLQIYPSPTSGLFTLNYPKLNGNSTITIYNVLGETIYSVQTSSSNNQFDLTSVEKGIYFIQIKAGKESVVKKIVKEN